jgi:uncharacterized protein (DUF433 family)
MRCMSDMSADELDQLVAAARRLKAPEGPALLVPRRMGEAPTIPDGRMGWGRHFARYVISDQYVPQFLAEQGAPYGIDRWPVALLNLCHRDDLLLALTAATRVAHEGGEALAQWTEYVVSSVDPALGKHLRASLQVTGLDIWSPEAVGRSPLVVDRAGKIHIRTEAEVVGLHGQLRMSGPDVLDLLGPFTYRGARGLDLVAPSRHVRNIPARVAGEPHIVGSRITTRSLAGFAARGMPATKIGALYDLDPAIVDEVLALERQLGGSKIAA